MKFILPILLIVLLFQPARAQMSETDREWNRPVEPFRIVGNVYYVGAAEITSFLIATPDGHVVIDGGYRETAPQIVANIKKLGFQPADVRVLLNSQAHYDHAGGLAELKRATGARLLVAPGDAPLIERGGTNDFHFNDRFPFEAVKVDKLLKDGEKIKLGGTTIKAVFTPGHTKGCTSFTVETTEDGRKYTVVFVGSTTVPGYDLAGNEKYPQIVADYEKSFRRLKKIRADVFLGSHGQFFGLAEKAEKRRQGNGPNPFVDPDGYRRFLEQTESQFRERLKAQRTAGAKPNAR